MTRKELIEQVRAGLGDEVGQRQVAAIVDGVFEAIAGALRDEGRYTHPGFGSFTVTVRNARPGRNPKTGEAMEIAEAKAVSFKASPELKAKIER